MKRATLVAAVVLATALTIAPLMAQDGPTGAPANDAGYLPEGTATPVGLSVLDVAGKLVIAVVLVWGIVRAVRWWHDGGWSIRGEDGRGGRRMWLEETLRLGGDARLYLVEVDGRSILLSSGEGGVVEVKSIADEPAVPSAYRSVRTRADGSTDELNVAHAEMSTRAVRPDVVESDESWEQRRGRLLRELQEQG